MQNIDHKEIQNNSSSKIIIDNCFDLYKLPLDTIKNTRLYNFSGKYYEKIFEEALKLEKEEIEKCDINNNDLLNIKEIEFEIFYLTEVK
jgi:hypothetical protein